MVYADSTFGPLLGGALFDAIGSHHMWMWGAVSGLCLLLAVTFVVYARLAASAAPSTTR